MACRGSRSTRPSRSPWWRSERSRVRLQRAEHHQHLYEPEFLVPKRSRHPPNHREAALLPRPYCGCIARDDIVELHRRKTQPPGGIERVFAEKSRKPLPPRFGRDDVARHWRRARPAPADWVGRSTSRSPDLLTPRRSKPPAVRTTASVPFPRWSARRRRTHRPPPRLRGRAPDDGPVGIVGGADGQPLSPLDCTIRYNPLNRAEYDHGPRLEEPNHA